MAAVICDHFFLPQMFSPLGSLFSLEPCLLGSWVFLGGNSSAAVNHMAGVLPVYFLRPAGWILVACRFYKTLKKCT